MLQADQILRMAAAKNLVDAVPTQFPSDRAGMERVVNVDVPFGNDSDPPQFHAS